MRFQSFETMLGYYAEKQPDAPAVLTEKSGERISVSYAGLLRDVRRRAEELRKDSHTAIGILCNGSYACIVEIFAAAAAGLQVIMLNENASAEQVSHTDADCLWGDDDLTEELSPALGAGVTDGRDRFLFFTSGTTSKMKAVVLTQQSLCASAYNGGALLPLSESDVLMCMLPLDHVFGFVCGLLWGLSCGATVALGRGARHYFDDLDFYRPTVLSAVPTLVGFLMQRRLLNNELKLVLIGAGDCPKEIPRELKAHGKRVCVGYGLTETSSGVALSLEDDVSAMTVCPETQVSLAEDGEILIRSASCMMQGYYKDETGTGAVLQNGALHTGDLGSFDADGRLHITGRKKEILVFSDGTKIFLPEYEQMLSETLPGREYAVICRAGAPVLVIRGDESERVELTLLLTDTMRSVPINRRLKDIIFISEPLPRTATGKIKRWELQQKV